jgi:hypothetical protein
MWFQEVEKISKMKNSQNSNIQHGGDRRVNELDCDNHNTIYAYQIATLYPFKIYIYIYIQAYR